MRQLGRLRLAGRVPVIAAGSNAAPARLAVKFRDRPTTTIPVTRARLRDHAVVYAAQLATALARSAIPWTTADRP